LSTRKPDPTRHQDAELELALQQRELYARAWAHLQRLLKHRARSVKEARERLRRAGYPVEILERVIAEAIAQGQLDDEAFARLWVQDRLTLKPKGRVLLVRELKAKGVDDEIIERVLSELEPETEESLIRELIERQALRYTHLDLNTRKRRLYAFLRRRGFPPEMIRRALQEFFA
jgi:regulatory protein